MPAPLGMDLDERRGNRHHMHVTWHGGANAEGEVDVIDPRYIAADQDLFPNLRPLLRGQADAAARLALLRLTSPGAPGGKAACSTGDDASSSRYSARARLRRARQASIIFARQAKYDRAQLWFLDLFRGL